MLISARVPSTITPSIKINGDWPPNKLVAPLNCMVAPAPGCPRFVTVTPATLPCKILAAEVGGASSISLELTEFTVTDNFFFYFGPATPVIIISSNKLASSSRVTLILFEEPTVFSDVLYPK